MLTPASNKAEKAATGMLILAVLVEMSGNFFYTARDYSYLHFRRTSVSIMALSFCYFISFLALGKHVRRIAHSLLHRKTCALAKF